MFVRTKVKKIAAEVTEYGTPDGIGMLGFNVPLDSIGHFGDGRYT